MEEYRGLTQLIGDIYDAAIDSSRWSDVLKSIAEFARGQAAILIKKDLAKKSGIVHYETGIDPHFVQLYFDNYWRLDPIMESYDWQVDQIASISEFLPRDRYRAAPFYREWAKPQGWIDAANAVLEKSATSSANLIILRNEASGMVDEYMRRRLALIVPHVRRAVRTGKLIDLSQAEAATFADMLDGLSPAIFLVDATGQIVHANAASKAVLERGDFLRTVHGRLTASDSQIDESLHQAFAFAGTAEDESSRKCRALPLKSRSGERYVAHVLPLTPGEKRKAAAASGAVAALFVRKAELEAGTPSEVIRKTYKLTPTELRVLQAIVNVGGVRQVAGNLGVADTTVKTHLGRLFEKTGVSRQADLVKLVAGYSSVLVD